jgi:hypothetical protein
MEQHWSFKRLTLVALLSAVVLMSFLFVHTSLTQGAVPSGARPVPELIQPPGAVRVTAALTYYLYLPVIFTPPPAISGRATQNGVPLVGAQVVLLSGSTLNMWPVPIATTVTDEDGYYRFYDIRSTISVADEKFRAVVYGELQWFTPLITYTNGTNYEFAPVDTTGLQLISPLADATITLPHTFSWTVRPAFPTDSYEVVFFTIFPFGNGTGPLGYVSSTVVSPMGDPSVYTQWAVKVYGSNGIGFTGLRSIHIQ